MVRRTDDQTSPLIPSVVVVDPCFEAYKPLVAAARSGRLDVHLRSSGREALKLAARRDVDAWLVAADLEDMSGDDFLALLDTLPEAAAARKAAVAGATGSDTDRPGVVLRHPISLDDLESLLRLPVSERTAGLPGIPSRGRGFVTLPVGIGAAVIAIAVLMMG
jgi:CheY-like chemotaxis protein